MPSPFSLYTLTSALSKMEKGFYRRSLWLQNIYFLPAAWFHPLAKA